MSREQLGLRRRKTATQDNYGSALDWLSLLGTVPRTSLKIWGDGTLNHFGRLLQKQRKRIATKHGNPRIRAIHFHTLRHWKGSTEYHRTKDIVHVSRLLGHKSIQNTLRYIQLQIVEDDNFICKTAKSMVEASKLIEAGFDYVTEIVWSEAVQKAKVVHGSISLLYLRCTFRHVGSIDAASQSHAWIRKKGLHEPPGMAGTSWARLALECIAHRSNSWA